MIRTVKFALHDFSDEPMVRESMRLCNWYLREIVRLQSTELKYLHRATYQQARELYPMLGSALVQSILRKAIAIAKRHQLRRGKKIPTTKSLSIPMRNQQFVFDGNSIKYYTPQGRKREQIDVRPHQQKWVTGVVQGLVIKCVGGRWWAYVSFKHTAPLRVTGDKDKVVGIDQGLRNTAALSSSELIVTKRMTKVRRKLHYQRRRLQSKGTRAAKRKLKVLAGRERRLTRDVLHCVTKAIAGHATAGFAVEDLTGIRKRNCGRRFNRRLSHWSFSMFVLFLSYKAEELGKSVEKVDARYTSQCCSRCGVVKKSHRRGSWYKCSECDFGCHADINAALNIKYKSLLYRGRAGCHHTQMERDNMQAKLVMLRAECRGRRSQPAQRVV